MKRAPATQKDNPDITAAQRDAQHVQPPDRPAPEICVITTCRAVSRMASLELTSGPEEIIHLGFPSRQISHEVQLNAILDMDDNLPNNSHGYIRADPGQERFAMPLADQVHAWMDLSPRSRAHTHLKSC